MARVLFPVKPAFRALDTTLVGPSGCPASASSTAHTDSLPSSADFRVLCPSTVQGHALATHIYLTNPAHDAMINMLIRLSRNAFLSGWKEPTVKMYIPRRQPVSSTASLVCRGGQHRMRQIGRNTCRGAGVGCGSGFRAP